MAGVSGRSRRVAIVNVAVGRVRFEEVRRQGEVPVMLLGDIVNVMAYESRR